MESRADTGEKADGREWLFALLALNFVGLGVAVYLSVLHWQVYNVPGHVSFCAISEGMNCDTVALSRYSVALGVPVSTWGIMFYLLLITLGVWGIRAGRKPFPWGIVTMLCAGAMGTTVFLFLVAQFLIRALCIMCLTLYVVNLANAAVCVMGLRRQGLPAGGAVNLVLKALASDLRLVFERRAGGIALAALAVCVAAAAIMVTPFMYPHEADTIAGGLEDIEHGRTPEGHEWIGAARPDVVITEYSDYECPFCHRAHMTVRQVVRERKDWLRLVHVQVPLDDKCNPMIKRPFHRNACDCARAAICAAGQDGFWPMNDALFLRRCGLDAGGLVVLARKLGLDADAFRVCMKDPRSLRLLQADLSECRSVAKECREMGRRFGTPTFTVGDKVVVGAKKKEFWVDMVERRRITSRKSP
ncbi:MAG TPA: vitamin K epoxide reductase family protein [Myxococcota bacterium]|nr:vitamin K epoxide reductase family protein [Myxococcota bacterium]